LRYLFEEYGFDTDRRELHRGADVVSVAPQVFDLLDYLIRNRERVVSKDDLINAIWNGRSVSDAALTTRLNAARSAIGDSGEEQRLIKTLPRKGFRFVGTVREAQRPASAAVADNPVEPPKLALALPDKPSIAILPFTNLSSDLEQEYFADGMVEDIITALSRFKSLFVIARNSSFTYRGRAVDVKQVGRELGVRYVLEGSVQKAGDRVRITGQLVDASTGVHIWADHFDDALKDIFDLQDRVAARVVGEIAPRLSLVEIERAHRKPTGNLEAYDWYLRAIGNYFPVTKEASEEALRLLYKAIELDPAFASAYDIAAWYYAWRKINRWMTDPVQESAEAVRLARRAAELGKDDAFALAWAGYSLAAVARELEDGAACLDRALELNPNLAVAWGSSGWVRVWLGQPELAIEHLARAMRLSPLDPIMPGFQTALAVAHFLAGHYDDASSWATRAGRMGPYFLRTALILVAASQALSGQYEEAQRAITRLRQLDPGLRLSNLRASTNIRGPEYVARLKEGLRKAGLPE
jgi:TolB-like protein/Tfp pilus assembly protein PilF